MMKSREFLLFKDKLIDYLRTFIKGLQRNVGVIEEHLRMLETKKKEQIIERIVKHEFSIPRMDVEVSMDMIEERIRGRYQSIEDWFVGHDGQDNEAGKLFDATNEIIRRITRYATQLSEKSALHANRREEYRKMANLFHRCKDIEEAHKLSAMIFGLEKPFHLKGEFLRETESMNSVVYEETPLEILLKPMTRNYGMKVRRSSIRDQKEEKERVRLEAIQQLKEDKRKLDALIIDGKVSFAHLPVIEPRIREILLKWLSDGLEDEERIGRTEDGRLYHLDMSEVETRCVVRCEDGNFTMPQISIVFEGEE